MIKFFRKIRQNLLKENKTGRYFKYALGEIILVVIGILIALQINNWNENRKLKSSEIKILQNFKSSLKADSLIISESDQVYSKVRNSIDYLIKYMDKDLPYKDSLKYHYGNITSDWGVRFDLTTYNVLKSKDLNLISNENLRSDIITYYSYAEGTVLQLSKRYTDVIEDASKTIFSKHFDQMWSSRQDNFQSEMIPVDYQKLKKDQEFKYFLKTLKNQNYWLIENAFNTTMRRLNDLVLGINKELEALEK
ncbi:DUF6090 family protein [Gaetbulibacter aestuarii]|uniref:DUF6090 family protein n=1 Tax=Gaetbulibacter aestuarii TaxID=1502358 RepID=A0ABW7MU66_9FLAO